MTATTKKPALPDFEGNDVHKAAVKFSGAGTGLSDGLTVQPVALETGDVVYFVGRYECRGVHHDMDKDDDLVRIHKLQTLDMAPIDQDTAQRVLAEYAAEVKRRKDEVEGQLSLEAEAAAVERERADLASTGAKQIPQPNFSKPPKP